jgi:hypothetical protein
LVAVRTPSTIAVWTRTGVVVVVVLVVLCAVVVLLWLLPPQAASPIPAAATITAAQSLFSKSDPPLGIESPGCALVRDRRRR